MSATGRVAREWYPAELLGEDEPVPNRTRRDWLVDVACFVGAALFAPLAYFGAEGGALHPQPVPLAVLDVAFGVATCLALWWRRSRPLAVLVLAVVATPFSTTSAGAAGVVVFSSVLHLRTRVAVAGAVLVGVGTMVATVIRPTEETFLGGAVTTVALLAILVAWAMFVRARRQLILSLRDRAERAEAEQRLQAEQARMAERSRIAREMHDVLAHRISLIALHAGALEVNGALPDEQRREAAGLIRATARQALEELRGVIGVLRSDQTAAADGSVPLPPPQPTLSDVPRLVDESRQAGARVALDFAVDDVEQVPAGIGRDAYRIVQEALTNVTKHARGAATTVSVHGGPEDGLAVTVRNKLPLRTAVSPSVLPGAGAGLVGLGERVQIAGGTLRHGRRGDEFEVAAVLPWEAS